MSAVGVAVVILTRGDRPEALGRAIESVNRQRNVTVDLIVVVNGGPEPEGLSKLTSSRPPTIIRLAENVGIPEGRNIGASHATEAFIAFLDDDAELLDDRVLERSAVQMQENGQLAAIAWRLVDEGGGTAARHVPRLGGRSVERSGEVTYFLGGAAVLRADVFRSIGGYCGPLFYSMEETDLSWRIIDHGWTIRYDTEARVYHPSSMPARHANDVATTARNRVWIAHRCLPLPLMVCYVITWLFLSSARSRRPQVVLRSTIAAWRTRPGPRDPIRWSTVGRLTRLGRPPVV